MRCLDYFYARIKRPRNVQLFLGCEGWLAWLEMPWGMGRNRGDRDETEKEVCGSATPKVVSAWSYDGGGGTTTPLMLSHPLSRRSTVSICVYLHTLFFIFLFRSFFLSSSLVFFFIAARVVLYWSRVSLSMTFQVRHLLYISPIKFKKERCSRLRNDLFYRLKGIKPLIKFLQKRITYLLIYS